MASSTASPTPNKNPSLILASTRRPALTPARRTPAARQSRTKPQPKKASAKKSANEPKKLRINWTEDMEAGMLRGLVEAVRAGFRADSSYNADGWQMGLDGAQAYTRYQISISQIKSKHNNYKRDWRI